MILTSQAQQTVLFISNYLIYLLSVTGDAYHKTLRIKAYSDILKKYLFSILDYTEVKFVYPPIL